MAPTPTSRSRAEHWGPFPPAQPLSSSRHCKGAHRTPRHPRGPPSCVPRTPPPSPPSEPSLPRRMAPQFPLPTPPRLQGQEGTALGSADSRPESLVQIPAPRVLALGPPCLSFLTCRRGISGTTRRSRRGVRAPLGSYKASLGPPPSLPPPPPGLRWPCPFQPLASAPTPLPPPSSRSSGPTMPAPPPFLLPFPDPLL